MSANTQSNPRAIDVAPKSPSALAHLVIRTDNFQAMRAFYLKLLNATPAFENDFLCFIRYDHEHHRLVLVSDPEHRAPQRSGVVLEHFSFSYDTLGDLLGNYCRLKALGILPVWTINHGFTTSIYYQDPDGTYVETQVDNMDVPAADAFMRGPYFAKNPIGVDFDVERLLARYLAGDPIDELQRFRSAPYDRGAQHLQIAGVPPYDADGDLL